MAQRFLGTNLDEVRVVAGHQANEKMLVASQEKYLLAEACRYGDILVRYTSAHRKLSFEQRVWGFSLALFCTRGDYPEGLEEFDKLADQGGDDLDLATLNHTRASEVEQPAELSIPDQQEAAQFAEAAARYIATKKRQMGLSNPQAAYGLGRAFHNLRLGYPRSDGGTAVFDVLAARAWDYYERYREA